MQRKLFKKTFFTKINVLLKALVHALRIRVKKIKSRKKTKKEEIKTEKDDKKTSSKTGHSRPLPHSSSPKP